MKICICGLTASGKSHQAKAIAKEFNLTYICASKILLNNVGIKSDKNHFWINEKGEELEKIRDKNISYDKATDTTILELAKKDNIIIDAWALPWLYKGKDIFYIYLTPSLDARSHFAMKSKKNKPYSIQEIKEKINNKDKRTIKRFKQLYNIDITDTKNFNLIVDNGKIETKETTKLLIKKIREYFYSNSA